MMIRGLKFPVLEVEGLYYLCMENKGTDHLHKFSHDAAQLLLGLWASSTVALSISHNYY